MFVKYFNVSNNIKEIIPFKKLNYLECLLGINNS